MRTLLTCLLLLLPVLRLTAKPLSLPPPVVPQCLGVNIHFTGQPTRDLDGLESAGVGWIRMDFAWSDIEKSQGNYDFSAYDALLAGLAARHIRPIFILDYGNDLYQQGPPTTAEARAAFVRFAAASAARYQGRGIVWEIWNEPNGSFWPPRPDARQYAVLALAVAHAIHASDPNSTVVGPASSGVPMDFLEALFRQGLLGELDAVSIHPDRTGEPEDALADDQALRLLIHRYAPPGKEIPILWSEWGNTTLALNETQQAQFLTREWLSGTADGVRLSLWYDWHDDDLETLNSEHHYGMVRADYSSKPTYLAARTLTHMLAGSRFIKRIPLASPDDYLLLFTGPLGSVRLAAWTAGADHNILLPIASVSKMTGMLGGTSTPDFAKGRLRLSLSGSAVYLELPASPALRQAAAWTLTQDDPFYTDSQPLRWNVSYHNPDSVAHRVRFEAVMMTADGGRTPVPGGTDNVGAGQTLTVGMASALRARVAVRVRVGLSVDGTLQPYPQDLIFSAADPITLNITPLPEGQLQVNIADPSGEAFSGNLSALGEKQVAPIPVRLAAGQTVLSLTLTAPAEDTWRLTDAKGHLVASVDIARVRQP